MNISFVLAVYNRLELTKECYKRLRDVYPEAPLVISSGGSSDGTKEWLQSLDDDNLSFFHDDDRLSFSETYNAGIDLVDTEKLVLIHNDMVIGQGFLESLDRLLEKDMILSYTTIEPPIFKGHQRPGKVLLDLGSNFDNFNQSLFDDFVSKFRNSEKLYDGAVFFMSAYKNVFQELNGFDGFTFVPCFCEDDDFLIRAKLKGYNLKTCDSAIVYHFVSQTSRFSDEMKEKRGNIEFASNRNFIRKWGIPIHTFNQINYQNQENFNYKKFSMGFLTENMGNLFDVEPFFDKVNVGEFPNQYIELEQQNTRYDLKSKFTDFDSVDVVVKEDNPMTQKDMELLYVLRLVVAQYEVGQYKIGNLSIDIKNKI